MVNFIRSLFVLSLLVSLTGCLKEQFHFYTRSLTKGADTPSYSFYDYSDHRVIPKELFNGVYERLSNYDGSPQGQLTFNTNKCLGVDLIADIDTDSRCAADDSSSVIKMNEIVALKGKLFVEAILKLGTFTKRYALFELIVTQDKFVLVPMKYDLDKIMSAGLAFSKWYKGENTYYEVQNKTHEAFRLVESMIHAGSGSEIHFRPATEELNQRLRNLLKRVQIQTWPKTVSCEEAAGGFRRSDARPMGNFVGTVL